jgi:hypothetical protein
MIESPLYGEIVEEAQREVRQQDILVTLEDRFGPEAKDVEALLKTVELDRLMELFRFARTCRSLASFRNRLLTS